MRGPSTPLSEVIESFLLAQVNLSPRTLDGYAQNLRAFDRWLGSGRIRDLTPDAVNAYILDRIAVAIARRGGMSLRELLGVAPGWAGGLTDEQYVREIEELADRIGGRP